MNLVPGAPTWLLVVLFLAMAAAAIEDFLRLRISNVTCAAVFITALVVIGLHGVTFDLWQNAVVFAVLLTCGTLLFAADKIGGGDVKLLASLGLLVNLSAGIWLLSTSLLAGGVLALIYIAVRHFRGGAKSKGIPYGIAIVAGASIVFAGQLGLMKSKAQPPDVFKMQPLR
jgi:Flp pilus assembly protein protease CpaA